MTNTRNIPYMPMTRAEMEAFGWDELDILLVTGDCYVDHPSYGTSLIGRMLLAQGYRVGIIAQPDWKNPNCMKAMGRPRIGAGVSSGNMDSMVNIYTAGRRLRREDVYSEEGRTGLRPPHALVVYTQLVKQSFSGLPVMVGGLEASLRRVAHYDYWQDKLRPSMLVDTKADILSFGQGEKSVTEIFGRLKDGKTLENIRGTSIFLGKNAAQSFNPGDKYLELPSWEDTQKDKDALMTATKLVESAMSPFGNHGLFQRYGDRLLVIEPPPEAMSCKDLDEVHDLPYSGSPHPSYRKRIPAFETIKHSIPAIRGCPGGCAFCGLVSHQGRYVTSRSPESIRHSVEAIAERKDFRGTITDIGGAAGNLYMSEIADTEKCAKCRRVSCLFPKICPNFHCDGLALVKLLREIRNMPKVKHLYINSGIRLDLTLHQQELFSELIRYHVSGHMKLAPEHLHPRVLELMRKSSAEDFFEVMKRFYEESAKCGKKQYVIPLFISNFPGCGDKEMKVVDDFLNKNNWSPQQVQDFIPLPMTMGAAMYYTGKAPDGTPIEVNRGLKERRGQIDMLKKTRPGSRRGCKNGK
ncbi:MAG: YgiQ family radical SAM protein, partial [Victivallaceae bacterium]